MQRRNHDINATFLCESCGNLINLLSLAYLKYYHKDYLVFFEALLDRGAEVDCPGLPIPALVSACRTRRYGSSSEEKEDNRLQIAKMLLERGADVHGIRNAMPAIRTDTSGRVAAVEQTPLMYAVAANKPALVSLLIDHVADVNRGSVAPLSIALRNRNMYRPEDDLELVDLLIGNGAETRKYDTILESQLDTALGLSGDKYHWSLERCFDCEMYSKDYSKCSDSDSDS